MSMIFTGRKAFRSVRTAGHSCFWQSRRSFQHSIRQCQLSGFASGQSECPVGDAEQSQQIRSTPKDHRTRAASVPQPFPTAVFAASSEQAAYRSLPHLCESLLIPLLLLSNSQPLRWVASWVKNGDGDAVPYAVLILNRQFHKQRQRAESNS